jgi:hypothetical protein
MLRDRQNPVRKKIFGGFFKRSVKYSSEPVVISKRSAIIFTASNYVFAPLIHIQPPNRKDLS